MTVPSGIRRSGFAIGVRLVRLSLRALGFARTVTVLRRLPQPFSHEPTNASAPTRWAGDISTVSRRPYGATCLDRSVFLWFVMRQRGLDGQIRIGVTLDGDILDGHAWVELDGSVVNDDPDIADRFEVFDDDPVGIVFS